MGAAARPLRRARHQRGRGGADRGRAAVRLAARLLAAGPARPPGRRTARPGRRVGRLRRATGATCCCTSPNSTGGSAASRRARRASSRWTPAAGPTGRRPGCPTSTRRGTAQRRAGRPRHGRLPASDGRSPRLPAGAGRASRRARLRAARHGRDGAGRGRQGGHPDPADPVRQAGHLHHARRRHGPGRPRLLRRQPRRLRAHRLPLLAAAGAREWCSGAARAASAWSGAAAWNLAELVELRRDGRPGRGRGPAGGARRRPEAGRTAGAGDADAGQASAEGRRGSHRHVARGTRCTPGPTSARRAIGRPPTGKLWHPSPGSAG